MNGSSDDGVVVDDVPSYLFTYVSGPVGALAALDNGFILVVFCCNKRLLTSSSLLIGLTLAHALNGAIHAVYSFCSLNSGLALVSSLHCIKRFYPNLFIAVYQLLPVLLALNGLERLSALAAPAWYRAKCTKRLLWSMTGAVYVGALLSMILNAAIAWYRDVLIPAACIPPHILGETYAAFSVHMLAIIGGVCASACSAIAVYCGKRRIAKMPKSSENEIKRVKKQIKLTQCLLMICGMDMVYVVGPNIVFFLYNLQYVHVPFYVTVYLMVIYSSDSLWNILAFAIFNTDFKNACRLIMRCGRSTATVHASTVTSRATIRNLPNHSQNKLNSGPRLVTHR